MIGSMITPFRVRCLQRLTPRPWIENWVKAERLFSRFLSDLSSRDVVQCDAIRKRITIGRFAKQGRRLTTR